MPGQPHLPFDADDDTPEEEDIKRNRVAGSCSRCATWLNVGEGQVISYGRKQVVICHPDCGRVAT